MVSKKSAKRSVKAAKAKTSTAPKKKTNLSVKLASSLKSAKSSPVKRAGMPVDVRQSCEYKGQDWWEWSVWIEASNRVLDEIDYVEYKLHATFPDPVRRATNRDEKFLIESAGWGEFMIGVEISTKKGERLKRQHWLTLDYPATPSKNLISSGAKLSKQERERPTLFLSAGITELGLANTLGDALEETGFEVVKVEDTPPDVPWDHAISLMIKRADLMVVLISGGLTSWGMREIAAAMKNNLPILPVTVGSFELPKELQGFQGIHLKDASNPAEIAPQLAQQINQSIKH